MALVACRALHRVSACASSCQARICLRASVAVVAVGPIDSCGVRARSRRRITAPYVVALIAGCAPHRIASRAGSGRASVGLRASVAVVATRPVGLRTPSCLASRGRALLALVDRAPGPGRIARPAYQTVSGGGRVGAGSVAIADVSGAGKSVVAAIRRAAAGARRTLVVAGASISVVAPGPVSPRSPAGLA